MKIFLETYGCQMNVSDSEIVCSVLAAAGHEIAPALEEAEVVLINTCAIRENAYRKIYGRLDRLRPHRLRMIKEKGHFVVGLLGCMAQNLKKDMFKHPVVNLVVGPDNYRALPDLIAKLAARDQIKQTEIDADLSEYETYQGIDPKRFDGVNAWVTIMRGCDNFCTFCVVPYTRGRERSRSLSDVLAEVHRLVAQGFSQVTLLGQNVNSYQAEGLSFADLIVAVADVPGVSRVRFTSPHPKDFPDALLEAIANHPNICKHIHLPLQSGSDRVLELMSRTYTGAEFLALAQKIRRSIPNVSISTDIIVGFPTETESDHQKTLILLKTVGFESAYIFKYSERKGTIASKKFPDDVSSALKTSRIVALFDTQREIALEKNRTKIGSTLNVMLEGESDKRPGFQVGKTEGNMTVIFPQTPHPLGTIIPIVVTDATSATLLGKSQSLSMPVLEMF
ncbi:MAG: tRNA (N6-isopentenyl adenosine(37)-C2)-methylthiotransferase MiaB [Nitrospirae bacterium]|nr:tRNA (N6-isopentenyl adenosine(37)-C2)-methylthiotransferase MiaB [Candidatus Manganitrophaceae bacterium]